MSIKVNHIMTKIGTHYVTHKKERKNNIV